MFSAAEGISLVTLAQVVMQPIVLFLAIGLRQASIPSRGCLKLNFCPSRYTVSAPSHFTARQPKMNYG